MNEKPHAPLAHIHASSGKLFDWLKLTMGSNAAILGLLISLRTTPSRTWEEHESFIFAISMLMTALVVGSVTLMVEINVVMGLGRFDRFAEESLPDQTEFHRAEKSLRASIITLGVGVVAYFFLFTYSLIQLLHYVRLAFAPVIQN